MNLIELYKKQPKILNLSEKVVAGFDKYVKENNIPEEEYYESVATFVNNLNYSNETKKGYRNRLRRFLYRNGIQ